MSPLVSGKLQNTKPIVFILCILFLFSCDYNNSSSNLKWTFKSPREVSWSGYGSASTPVETGNYIVYSGGYFWQNQVYLYVVDKNTGKLLWKNEIPTYQFVASKDHVIISSSESIHKKNPGKSRISKIVCYKLSTGEKLWTRKLSIKYTEPTIFPLSKSSKSVYVWLPGQEIFCLDKDTGKLVWGQGNSKTSSLFSKSVITTSGDTIYLAEPTGQLLVIQGIKGVLTNKFKLDGLPRALISSVQFNDDKIIVSGSTGYLTIFDLKNKELLMNRQLGVIKDNVALSDSKVYFGRTQKVKSLKPESKFSFTCIDLESKKVLWEKEFQDKKFSKPEIGLNNVFVGALKKNKNFYALSKSSGKITWQNEIGPIKGKPIYDSGTLYISGKDYFYALNAFDGTEIWKVKPLEFEPTSIPLVTKNDVYFVGQDAYLYCMKASPSISNSESIQTLDMNSRKPELTDEPSKDKSIDSSIQKGTESLPDKNNQKNRSQNSTNTKPSKNGKIGVKSSSVKDQTSSKSELEK